MIGQAGRVLGRARVISGVTGRDGIDGQQRNAAVQAHRRDAHLRGQFLAVERPAKLDGQVALGDGALQRHRLARRDGLVVRIERNDARHHYVVGSKQTKSTFNEESQAIAGVHLVRRSPTLSIGGDLVTLPGCWWTIQTKPITTSPSILERISECRGGATLGWEGKELVAFGKKKTSFFFVNERTLDE